MDIKNMTKHPEGCGCTYCEPAEDVFLKEPEIEDVLENPQEPEIYAFEGQTEEDVKRLLKEEKENRKGVGKEIGKEILDNLFKSNPEIKKDPAEIHRFINQEKGDVERLIRLAAQQAANPKYVDIQHKEVIDPKLVGDQDPEYEVNIRNLKSENKFDMNCFATCDWRKLAGLTQEESIDIEYKNGLEEEVISFAQDVFSSCTGPELEWNGDCFDKTLLINGCKSKFRLGMLYEAQKAIALFTDNQAANRAVAAIVVDKLKEVFV